MNGWLYLMIAILAEVGGTTSMKLSAGLTRLGPSIGVFACYSASLMALTQALRSLEISVAYAIWSGLGMVLISLVGVFWFGEPMPIQKLASVGLILLGVVGLNLSGKAP